MKPLPATGPCSFFVHTVSRFHRAANQRIADKRTHVDMTNCTRWLRDIARSKKASMQFADLYEAQKCRAALVELIIHNAGGWPDRRALVRVDELCQAAMGAIEDAECAAHIKTIAEYAGALYSERAHRKWDRGSMRGTDFLRLEIVRALHSLDRRLCAVETKRRETG